MINKSRIDTHRAISEGLLEICSKTPGLSLSPKDINIIRSSTLCCSFMRLEVIERSLIQASNLEDIKQVLKFLELQIREHGAAIESDLLNFAKAESIAISEYDNLLTLEIIIQEGLQSRNTPWYLKKL